MDNDNSYELQFDLDVNCFFIKHLGNFDFDALMARSAAIFKHPSFMPHINSVIDFRDCTLNLSPDELTQGAHTIRERAASRDTAREIIFVKDQFSYGVTREYVARIDTGMLERRILSTKMGIDCSEVKQFLGIDESYSFPEFLNF
ncbi:MAG: hypothetical protein V7740_06830 [Pseudomonas marincola]